MESLSAVATQLSLPDGSFLLINFQGFNFRKPWTIHERKTYAKTDGIRVFVSLLLLLSYTLELACNAAKCGKATVCFTPWKSGYSLRPPHITLNLNPIPIQLCAFVHLLSYRMLPKRQANVSAHGVCLGEPKTSRQSYTKQQFPKFQIRIVEKER